MDNNTCADMVNMIDNDLISRTAAIRELEESPYSWVIDWTKAICILKNLPAVELPRTGRWIKETDRTNHWHCSECGFVEGVHVMVSEFCPACGVKCGAVKPEDIDR